MPISTPPDLLPRLRRAWSHETGAKWREDNPACGQCSVTALVVQDVFGGEILTTRIGGAWHFYNQIDGSRFDLTESQFTVRFSYEDRKKQCDEALADSSPSCYAALRRNLGLKRIIG
jgi:hypothetical protein